MHPFMSRNSERKKKNILKFEINWKLSTFNNPLDYAFHT